jgi:hypothetical protein
MNTPVSYLQQSRHHAVAEDDGLQLALDVVAVLTRQHVDLALIHAQLADVSLHITGYMAICNTVSLGLSEVDCLSIAAVFLRQQVDLIHAQLADVSLHKTPWEHDG